MANVTIYDVAREAQVSTATVSLVLKNSSRIKEETRQRVMEVVNRLGYTPNFTARSLSKKSTNTLGLVVPNLENPVFAQMIAGVEECANSRGYNLILGVSNQNREKESFYLDMLQQKRVDGMLVFPTFIDNIQEKLSYLSKEEHTPIVLCGSTGKGNPDISFVKCDNRMGAYMAVDHLISTGRTRVGCILPAVSEHQYASRKAGYQDVLAFHGIKYDEMLIKVCQPDNESIFRATVELIEHEKVNGLFCLYDYITIYVMRAIVSRGLSIPQDVAVIGYDNINISEYLPVSLSTIDTHSQRVGRMATEILVDKIENPDQPIRQIVLKPELVVRESTAV